MSKKTIRNKYKNGYYFKNGKLYHTGKWLKKYFLTRTCKRKYSLQNE